MMPRIPVGILAEAGERFGYISQNRGMKRYFVAGPFRGALNSSDFFDLRHADC